MARRGRGGVRVLRPAAMLCLFIGFGCEEPAPEPATVEPAPIGDATRGRALMAELQCARCHEGTGQPDPSIELRCVGCHQAVEAGTLEAPEEELAAWRSRMHSLPDAPNLGAARRLDPEWVAAFLLDPVDVRPGLEATMPRYALTEADARDLAAAIADGSPEAEEAELGDAARGRALVASHGCAACHGGPSPGPNPSYSGAAPFGGRAGLVRNESAGRRGGEEGAFAARTRNVGGANPAPGLGASALAPDLAWAARRMTTAALVSWLEDPARYGGTMPATGLSRREAQDVAAYLATLSPPSRPEAPPMLPPLAREVGWDEVNAALFHRVCRHCHADPTFALGDGGAGNTGGFGFEARGLDLSSYGGVRSGSLDADGERASVFREVEIEGRRMPLIVAVLRARQLEEAGRPVEGIRGMPLGLPSVPPRTIQLLEAWIAAGRPRG